MNCVFGLFDILGFRSFCENCEPQLAEAVLRLLDEFETEIPKQIWLQFDPENKIPPEKKELVTGRLRWLIFSDTVLIAMPVENSAHPDTLKFNVVLFTALVSYINRRMFEIGLPVRGCIHFGEVFLGRRSLAGKGIVEAYKLSQRVQAAVTIVSDRAIRFFLDVFSSLGAFRGMVGDLIIECDIPTDTSNSEKVNTLCWLFFNIGRSNPFNMSTDLNKFITEQFTALGKTLDGEREMAKVRNTEKLFKDWKAANHLQYLKGVFHCR